MGSDNRYTIPWPLVGLKKSINCGSKAGKFDPKLMKIGQIVPCASMIVDF